MYGLQLLFRDYEIKEIRKSFESFALAVKTYDEVSDDTRRGGHGGIYAPDAITF